MSEEDGVQSPWAKLGHPAFNDDLLFDLNEIEWWNNEDLESNDIINS